MQVAVGRMPYRKSDLDVFVTEADYYHVSMFLDYNCYNKQTVIDAHDYNAEDDCMDYESVEDEKRVVIPEGARFYLRRWEHEDSNHNIDVIICHDVPRHLASFDFLVASRTHLAITDNGEVRIQRTNPDALFRYIFVCISCMI